MTLPRRASRIALRTTSNDDEGWHPMANPYPTSVRVSPREYEVWELIAHGASYGDLCHYLRGPTGQPLSQQTVKGHVTQLLRRVGVATSLELCVVWYGGALLYHVEPRLDPSCSGPRTRPHTREHPRYPTAGVADRATALTIEEREARVLAHPWRRTMIQPRGDRVLSHD